jgi:hypothetical protein
MSADNPYDDLNEARVQAAHHAEQARQWADAADREEIVERGPGEDEKFRQQRRKERARRYAAISQAHSLAALATAIGGAGIVSVEDLSR